MSKSFYHHLSSSLLLFFLLFTSTAHSQYLQGLELYQPLDDKSKVIGKLSSRGSTRVEPLLRDWVRLFRKSYPHVAFDIEAKGSETAPIALMNGSVNLAAMSRPMSQAEVADFQTMKGYPPVEVRVAIDAVVVHVHRVNSLTRLSLSQLDAIFSAQRKCGYPEEITYWSQLGDVDKIKIERYLLHQAAGARGFFQKEALCLGDFRKANIDTLVTRAEMLSAVAKSRTAIGFSGLGAANLNTKVLALSRKQEFPSYTPTIENIASGNYPLARYLYLYIDQPPNAPMPELLREFLLFVLSRDGQKIAEHHQAIALPPRAIGEELDVLGGYQ